MVGTFLFNFKLHRPREARRPAATADRWSDKLVCAGNIWD